VADRTSGPERAWTRMVRMTAVGLVRVLEIDGLAFRRLPVTAHVLEQSTLAVLRVLQPFN
jgi:hypothetical protein